MAMGRRTDQGRTPEMWVATHTLPQSPGHPFYQALNRALEAEGFDTFVEAQCAPFYAATVGRPSLLPGRYFRLLLIGYFEGQDSERGIAWRTADSLSLRAFLGLGLEEATPEHSTIARTRRRIDLETHRAVFTWVLQVLAQADLVKGVTVGVDATTLEANAALRTIVRRDSGERYDAFLTRLAVESGIETPTRADLARLDRKRPKKGRNADWQHPHDPEARITKMKDGRTHLAHKAEHAVDMDTGAVVGVTVQGADEGDTTTVCDTLVEAADELEAVAAVTDGCTGVIENVVMDKGYHSNHVLVGLAEAGFRTFVAEPARGRRCWRGQPEARAAVYANRRRITSPRGRALQRQRSLRLEQPNAHLYENRRDATHASARARQHHEAAPRARCRLQSGATDAARSRRRHPARAPVSDGACRRRPRRHLDGARHRGRPLVRRRAHRGDLAHAGVAPGTPAHGAARGVFSHGLLAAGCRKASG